MTVPRGLVLCGNSVFLAGLEAALIGYSALGPVTIESARSRISARIKEMNPRAVLFDRSASQPDLSLRLLCEHPDMLVIGLDACSDEIVILSLRKEHVSSIADLVKVINQDGNELPPVNS